MDCTQPSPHCPQRSTTQACGRCERLPSQDFEQGRLLLSFPLGHSAGKFRQLLDQAGLEAEALAGGCAVRLDAVRLSQLATRLRTAFSPLELRDTRALLLTGDESPGLDSWQQVETLDALCGRLDGAWVRDLLAEGRFTSHFHPIIALDGPMRLFAYECLLRGSSAEGPIGPGRILEAARAADLMFFLDRAARIAAIREAARHKIEAKLFINFTPTSIYDPAFCLRTTVETANEAGFPHEQIVFEVIESDQVDNIDQLRRILDFYRERGFLVALDDLGSGFSSLNLLHQLRPDFVKLDMALIRDVHTDPYRATLSAKLIEAAKALDLKVVAEGIESAEELAWVRSHGVDYAQGYHFARPASPPPIPILPG